VSSRLEANVLEERSCQPRFETSSGCNMWHRSSGSRPSGTSGKGWSGSGWGCQNPRRLLPMFAPTDRPPGVGSPDWSAVAGALRGRLRQHRFQPGPGTSGSRQRRRQHNSGRLQSGCVGMVSALITAPWHRGRAVTLEIAPFDLSLWCAPLDGQLLTQGNTYVADLSRLFGTPRP
jgi:hypothetical protein